MQLQFLDATGTVTGSKYLLRHEGSTILVDCDLLQGFKQLRLRNWAPMPVPPDQIDAIVLTHAHIDHSGDATDDSRAPWRTARLIRLSPCDGTRWPGLPGAHTKEHS